MANTILTPSVIANEALMVLKNNLVMANLVHRDYEKEFVKVGDTITVRKPSKFVAKNFTGTVSPQDLDEGSVSVKMDRLRDVSVPITSKEMSLSIKDFSSQVITPAMEAISQAVDADTLAMAVQSASRSITATADSSSNRIDDIAKAGMYLDVAKVPIQNRRLVLNPFHKKKYATDDNMSKIAYAGDGKALRDAELGRVYTMDTYMSQNAPYPYGYIDNAVGTATSYKITATKGESKIAISDLNTATATVKKGDCFIVDGYVYRIAEDKTGASSAIATCNIDQPIHKDFTAESVTVISSPTSVGFHRNGIALVTRALDLPMGNKNAYVASADGLAVRVVIDYDSNTKKDTVSFDIIYGLAKLDESMLVKIAG